MPVSSGSPIVRPPATWLVAVAAVVFVWVTADVLHQGPLTHVDAAVVRLVQWIDVPGSPRVKPLVYAGTLFGARGVAAPGCGLFVLATGIWYRTPRPVVLFAVLATAITLVGYGLKYRIGRSAPEFGFDIVHSVSGTSYPSGHVPNALLLWGLAAWMAADYRMPASLVRALAVLRWVAPVFAGGAMVLLDYHWLSDVIGGYAIGIVLLWALYGLDAIALGHWRGAGSADRTGSGGSGSGSGSGGGAGLAADAGARGADGGPNGAGRGGEPGDPAGPSRDRAPGGWASGRAAGDRAPGRRGPAD